MSKKVSPIPRGYRTATTCMTVIDVDSAVAFYQAAFAAELLTRQRGADEAVALHATIKIGNSIVALSREVPEMGMLAPVSQGVRSSLVHLYLDDVDTSWDRAVEAGSRQRDCRGEPANAAAGDEDGRMLRHRAGRQAAGAPGGAVAT